MSSVNDLQQNALFGRGGGGVAVEGPRTEWMEEKSSGIFVMEMLST